LQTPDNSFTSNSRRRTCTRRRNLLWPKFLPTRQSAVSASSRKPTARCSFSACRRWWPKAGWRQTSSSFIGSSVTSKVVPLSSLATWTRPAHSGIGRKILTMSSWERRSAISTPQVINCSAPSMGRSRWRRLVIDASVAGAAGDREATPSRECSAFLEVLRDLKHHVAMSRPLLEEWHEHQTRFASSWLRSMFARRCVEMVEIEEDTALRTALQEAVPRPRIAAILLKDAHLIELALMVDRRVIALDEEARTHFGQAAEMVAALRTIYWVNPA